MEIVEHQIGSSEIIEVFTKAGCDVDLMDIFQIYGKVISATAFPPVEFPMYTLTKRLTRDELIKRFANNFKNIQDKMFSLLEDATKEFTSNIAACVQMDTILGTSSNNMQINPQEDGNEQVVTLKDGTKRLKCPVHLCSTETFKLKRHLRDIHSLTLKQEELALKMAQQMENNKGKSNVNKPLVTTKEHNRGKVMRDGGTSWVAKKGNYKECSVCKNLYVNLTDHFNNIHNMTNKDANYYHHLELSKVVPLVYTKIENGRRVKLVGEELEVAEMLHADKIQEQTSSLINLKICRKNLEELKKKIQSSQNLSEEQLTKLKETMATEQKKYFEHRYPDSRSYSSSLKTWVVHYLKHLEENKEKNPKRIQRMATDVIIMYENETKNSIKYDDVKNPRILRDILRCFRKKNISSVSKIKYLGQFSAFLKFLFLSPDSPEYEESPSSEQLASMNFVSSQIQHQVKSEITILHKLKCSEVIMRKKKAEKNVISEQDMNEILLQTSKYLEEVEKDFKEGDYAKYGRKNAIKIRNTLMAAATIRLGRRSLELTMMTEDEVDAATQKNVNDETFFIVDVVTHKNSASLKPSPVAFSQTEFFVLKNFIEHLRSLLVPNVRLCKYAFPPVSKVNTGSEQNMTVQAAYMILNSFKTKSGKALSSRVIRKSKVTNNRKRKSSEETINHLAASMNHSRRTADNHYDLTSLHESVEHTLSVDMNHSLNYEPNSSSASRITRKSLIDLVPSCASTPVKSPEKRDESPDLDITLKDLRNKKIKVMKSTPQLQKKIHSFLNDIQKNKLEHTIKTKTGKLSARCLRNLLPENLQNTPLKKLEEIMNKHF